MNFTPEELEVEVRKIAAEYPDFVYVDQKVRDSVKPFGACSYACGVRADDRVGMSYHYGKNIYGGEDIHYGGLNEATVKKYMEDAENGKLGYSCIVGQALRNLGATTVDLMEFDDVGSVEDVLYDMGYKSNNPSYVWLNRVQTGQDSGLSWKEAVEVADAKASRVA